MGTILPFLAGCLVGYFAFAFALRAFFETVRELFSDERPDKFASLCGSIFLGFILWAVFYWAYSDGNAGVYGIIVGMIWPNFAND